MKRIRIGIFGAGRGMELARCIMLAGGEIAAICDFHGERLASAVSCFDRTVAAYDDFDRFIEHPMDGVILANYFPEHAPYAIRCMERGIHVFSECISNGTMAEGVQLFLAAEKSKSIYMLGENYPHMRCNREIKRICDGRTLGKIVYAEGEYNHPGNPMDLSFKKMYNYFPEHWRNYLPRTYYITHSLGPIMHATGATPKRVTAVASFAPIEGDVPSASMVGDRAAIITTQNDDGSVFRVVGNASFGARHNAYRVCGTKGQIETVRGMQDKVMLRYNPWDLPEGARENELYTPDWNDRDEVLINTATHEGADYFTARMFLNCIREGKQPEFPFDLHSAITMSSVAILAHRSVMGGGKPYDIPDFRREEDRLRYENDWISPFIGAKGEPPSMPCCSKPDFAPTGEQRELFCRQVMGHSIG